MSKRFTDTAKWDDPWFAELSTKHKLLWVYLCDKCNQVGIIDYSQRIVEFNIGEKVDIAEFINLADGRIVRLKNGKLFLTKFIDFQIGTISSKSPAHKPIIKLIEQNPEILEYPIPYPKARVSTTLSGRLPSNLQEREREKEMEKEEEKEKDKALIQPSPKLIQLYEQVCGLVSGKLLLWLNELAYPPDWIEKALLLTQKQNPGEPVAYCAKILQNYKNNGGLPHDQQLRSEDKRHPTRDTTSGVIDLENLGRIKPEDT